MNTNKPTQIYLKSFITKSRIKKMNEDLLTETVRKYTVLYDKSRADFKNRRKKYYHGMMLREILGYQML